MKASIIVPAYKPVDLLKKCLEGVISNTHLENVEIIVVCNGSDYESAEYVLKLGEPFKLVWYTEPLGFTKAVNIGIKLSKSDNIVLLNTDAIILNFYEKDVWLDRLINPLQLENVGITGLGFMYTKFGPYAPFFCTGIKKKLFEKIGFLDEEFSPGYCEDADFCYKAKKLNYEIVQVDNPHVDPDDPRRTITDYPIWHIGEQSFVDKTERLNVINKNLDLLAKRYARSGVHTGKPEIDLKWLEKINNEIFKEVIQQNEYKLSREIVQGKNVIDIGANVGMFSIFAAYLGAKIVVAAEPAQSTFDILKENVEFSNFKNIKIFKNAVLNVQGTKIKLPLQPDSGHTSLFRESENFEMVETITFHDLLNQVSSDGDIILKIDCEGSEYDILLNLSNNDLNRVKILHIEIHADTHPLYRGFEILEDKILSFGFTKVHDGRMFGYIIDEQGKIVGGTPLPTKMCIFERL